jgi:predicted nucleic acid-binding protein
VNYIFDTNAIIDLLEGKLSPAAINILTNVIAEVSVISKIELLGYHRINLHQQTTIENFLKKSILHPLNDNIVDECIKIRKQINIKTPDAIIAATAIVQNLTLFSRNLKDFSTIPGLTIIDPYTL